jgi:hypothetical protein
MFLVGRWRMKHGPVGGVVLIGVILASMIVSGTAQGNTFSVRNKRDQGPGSLRAAITAANAEPGRDVITFAPSARGTINLSKALPSLRAVLEIRGPGASRLAVQRSFARGTPAFRVFTVPNGSFVTLSGLRVSNGLTTGSPYRGGGIYNLGKLTLRRMNVSGNDVTNGGGGGGMFNDGSATVVDSTSANNYVDVIGAGISNSGTLTVENSAISNNYADGGAGGIENGFGATATVEGSSFVGNDATESAGGISNDGDLTVRDSTFSANGASFSTGGAMHNSGDLRVERSTFTANEAYRHGGGIYSFGDLTVSNSTFYANRTDTGFLEDDGGGGAVYNSGTAAVVGSTLSANQAARTGGGIYHASTDAADSSSLRMTIVADNTAPEGPDASGTFTSEGYNLIENPSGSTGFEPTDIQNVDPALDPEGSQDNGGPTRTIALQPESPAIDAVEAGCPPPATDQRGVVRPRDGNADGESFCDIGAFERRFQQ